MCVCAVLEVFERKAQQKEEIMANVEKNFAWNIASFILWLQRFLLKKEELKRNRNFFATGDIQTEVEVKSEANVRAKKTVKLCRKTLSIHFVQMNWFYGLLNELFAMTLGLFFILLLFLCFWVDVA